MNHETNVRPSRVVIARVSPEVDGGRYAAKRFIGEHVEVKAILLVDGHDRLKGRLKFRHETETEFQTVDLSHLGNDEWGGRFLPRLLGRYFVTLEASIDRFTTWKQDLLKKLQANQTVSVEIKSGCLLFTDWLSQIENPLDRSERAFLLRVRQQLEGLAGGESDSSTLSAVLSQSELFDIAARMNDDLSLVRLDREIPIQIEPAHAGFSTWYEFFPRSVFRSTRDVNSAQTAHNAHNANTASNAGNANNAHNAHNAGNASNATPTHATIDNHFSESFHHGNLRSAAAHLEYVARLGFDVVYLPPIHPIGFRFRKGKNNSLQAHADDVGSPWAIGSELGGHTAIHPALGSFEDFEHLIQSAEVHGIRIAMDLAFQCSPDHPWVRDRPEWFKRRPDGSIQYAENPPKKYQDTYPFDFECESWSELWRALLEVVQFWIERGVRIFRVDNPHTKALAFWEWLIREVRVKDPDVVFLAEAFTRPHLMSHLGKIGFSQSYTYFTWRNTKWELTQYLSELTSPEMVETFVPCFWPNTPDILPEVLQSGKPGVFIQRLILAATLSSNYGIYGPAFELLEHVPREAGSEEYLDSEKYQVRTWHTDPQKSIAPVIAQMNRIRSARPALKNIRSLRFHLVNNEHLIAYSKSAPLEDGTTERILVVVNLDSEHRHSGFVELPLFDWGIDPEETFQVHDLLSGARYFWRGWRNYVELDPGQIPAHIFIVKPNVRSVHDFEYFV